MKSDVIFDLENVSWPALLLDAGGVVLKTSLDETNEKVLRDALASAAERPAA